MDPLRLQLMLFGLYLRSISLRFLRSSARLDAAARGGRMLWLKAVPAKHPPP